ncbi:MAG: ubiquinol-cytochrome C chaperone family protein [Rhizobiaceae bacterium]
MKGTFFSTLFGGVIRRKKRLEHAHFLYGVVVASARNPDLFRNFDIPDTFDGRFEMLATHLYVLNDRLRQDGDEGRALSQEIIDFFIADMDVALREAAVGDQVVPKRLAKMTRVVHGRAAAYDRARIGESDVQKEMAAIVARNVFNGRVPRQAEFAMANWMLEQIASLAKRPLDRILAGSDLFGRISTSETETV